MGKKYFPIKTQTACQLKWAWSTIHLNTGITRSCHRTSESALTPENFLDFHNTPIKIADRESMLRGEWPGDNCDYCQDIERKGGISDRIRMSAIPDLSPEILFENPNATHVDPTLVEVYFSNACNMGCLYCGDTWSSTIEAENRKFGIFKSGDVVIQNSPGYFKNLIPYFWEWFETGFQKIKRLHVLGGEPLYQKEFDKLLEMIISNPNPDCELNVVTNLMVSPDRLKDFVDRFQNLLVKRAIRRVDITCSIDCFGPEQEYVRWGINVEQWKQNFEYLLSKKWLTVNINQTIMPLTIKTMPALLEQLQTWRQQRPVGHFFSGIHRSSDYLKLDVFGHDIFKDDIEKILDLMPTDTEEDRMARQYMQGILGQMNNTTPNIKQIKNLAIYLDEKDRRRGTDWRKTFPWIVKEFKNVVQ